MIDYNKEYLVGAVQGKQKSPTLESIVKEFPEVFSGKIGKAKGVQVEIMVDESVTPVVQWPRKFPINLTDATREKMEFLTGEDIVERFPDTEPRTWVSPPVVSIKPDGGVRLCVDMRLVNNAIKRPFTQIPTMEDVKAKFAGATRFSKLDLKEAYHQIELEPKSRNLTEYYGPDGLYRYKRLNYGTKSAQDILQIQMQKMLVDVPHQMNIADDILIGGSPEEHDSALRQVIQVLWENGYTLNIKKCIIDAEEVIFAGLLFGEKGVRPDPKT